MLSIKEGRPLAFIKGGKYDNEVLYVNDKADQIADLPLDVLIDEMDINDLFKNLKPRERSRKVTELKSMLHGKVAPNAIMQSLYNGAMNDLTDSAKKELRIIDGIIKPIPNPDGRECVYIAGPSGSGKSTWIGNYADEFRKIFPNKPIYLFSKVDEDEALDKLNPIRIKLDMELVSEPVETTELQESLVIFDDTDTISDKNILTAVNTLKDAILETGRHTNIYCCIVSHLITNYKESRKVLNECHSIVIFPSSGSSNQIKYCMKNYVGMDMKDIQKLLKLGSRWVQVHKHYPQCVVYEKGAYLISGANV